MVSIHGENMAFATFSQGELQNGHVMNLDTSLRADFLEDDAGEFVPIVVEVELGEQTYSAEITGTSPPNRSGEDLPFLQIPLGNQRQYTFVFERSMPREIGYAGDAALPATVITSPLLAARNSWNPLSPDERGLVFAPRYNRNYFSRLEGGRWKRDRDDGAHETLRAEFAQKVGETMAEIQSEIGELQARINASTSREEKKELKKIRDEKAGQRSSAWLNQYTLSDGNTYKIKDPNDATGSFHIGASTFCKYWIGRMTYVQIDNGLANVIAPIRNTPEGDGLDYHVRFEQVLRVFAACRDRNIRDLSVIAFFSHGFENGMQLVGSERPDRSEVHPRMEKHGFEGDTLAQLLANAIGAVSRADVVVILYACSTGGESEAKHASSFAARLRNELCKTKPYCRIVGHTETAHAFKNSGIRYFEGISPNDAGVQLVPNERKQKFMDLVTRVRTRGYTDRFEYPGFVWAYPLMSVAAVRQILATEPLPASAFAMPATTETQPLVLAAGWDQGDPLPSVG
jgi:hypothetical protein